MPKKIMLVFSAKLDPARLKHIRDSLVDFVADPKSSISLVDGVPGEIRAVVIESDAWDVQVVTGQPELPKSRKPRTTSNNKE